MEILLGIGFTLVWVEVFRIILAEKRLGPWQIQQRLYNRSMNEQEQREYFASLTKEQLIEILVVSLENEKEMRKALDNAQGIVR